jgi:hypothetical protein
VADAPRAIEAVRQLQVPPALGIDPGYRPMRVPDSYDWNGLETVRVPGHWVW